jgi:hypothetical protein
MFVEYLGFTVRTGKVMNRMTTEELKKRAVRDFVRAHSCSFSVAKNLATVLRSEAPPEILYAVVGLSGGICGMRDTCGSVNSGVAILGRLYPHNKMPPALFSALCSEYYDRVKKKLFTPNCSLVHRDDARTIAHENFKGGVTKKCMALVKTGAETIVDLKEATDQGDPLYLQNRDIINLEKVNRYFSDNSFHCCKSVLDIVANRTGIDIRPLDDACRGFVGGIGFNGTLCGAIVGGILCLGLYHKVGLSNSTYFYTLNVEIHKMFKGNAVFYEDRVFKPARLFSAGKKVYLHISQKYGALHCKDILKLDLSLDRDSDEYIRTSKLNICQTIVNEIADTTIALIHG